MRTPALASMILFFALLSPATADEVAVYESLSQVSVGRIFFSVSERARLDAQRAGNPAPRSAPRSSSSVRTKSNADDAAGYFVDDQGRAWIYRDGDFVAVADAPKIEFQNDVNVVRVDASRQPPKRSDDEQD